MTSARCGTMDYTLLYRVGGTSSSGSRGIIRALLVLLAACAPLPQLQAATAGLIPEICASMSSASGSSLTHATAGVTQSFIITARDDSGIPVSFDAGTTFVMRLGDQLARASAQHTPGAATYVGSYDVSASGVDRLSLLLAKCK